MKFRLSYMDVDGGHHSFLYDAHNIDIGNLESYRSPDSFSHTMFSRLVRLYSEATPNPSFAENASPNYDTLHACEQASVPDWELVWRLRDGWDGENFNHHMVVVANRCGVKS